ncbi:tryptophan 7-halogenase [Paraglaciecola aquimarina]|uniref:Tryptophan 7-halogenase n=2 Tax=Paraglaciecola algarum TaxID=3050085 RepID=A0ABS9D5X6_9ALTE|nr:tryptophan 7-halogenase [Paraglaciecola sp. G1-23]
MHYYTAQNKHSDFWKACTSMKIPTSLEKHLAEFKQTGFITLPKQSLFSYPSWFQVLVGQNYLPNYKKFNNPPVDLDTARDYFKMISHIIQHDVASLPDYNGLSI